MWEHERWVVQLATDLRHAGIGVVLDRWDNAEPGASISRFISLINNREFIAVVGTPEYKRKYENEGSPTGYVAASEFDLIVPGSQVPEVNKRSILPLLLVGDVLASFPPLLHGRVYVDFSRDDQYFLQLLDVIIKMFGCPSVIPLLSIFRESMLAETRKTGTLIVA